MGLAWKGQYVKLTKKFGSSTVKIIATGGDGKQHKMVCLSLRKFPAWVYSVNLGKIAPALREKILRYQKECDAAAGIAMVAENHEHPTPERR
jgi:hypothetical protein